MPGPLHINVGKAPAEEDDVAVNAAGVIFDGDADPVAVSDPGFQEHGPGDIGPEAAEPDVQHVNGAADRFSVQIRLHHRQAHQLLHIQGGSHTLKTDDPGGKPGTGESIDIPAMEGIALSGPGKPVDGLVDLPRRFDAVQPEHVGQGAIVRRHDVLPRPGLHHHTFPVGAHAGIHHGDEHRPPGPVIDGLDQTVAGLPDMEGRDLMGQIVDPQIRMHRIGNTVHGADRAVHQAEIGLKYQRFHMPSLLFP